MSESNTDDLRSTVLTALRSVAPEARNVADDDDLREALELDSMDFLRFVVALHDALGRDIPEKDYPRLASVGAAVQYLGEARAP